MNLSKAPKAAALSLVATFACTNALNVKAACDTNITDLKSLTFDLEPPSELDPLASMGWYKIKNMGTVPSRGRIYFDVYEIDPNNVVIRHVKRVYNDNSIPAGGELVRAMSFSNSAMSLGRHYKGDVVYECDVTPTNNTLFQTAYNMGAVILPDQIFKDGFDTAPAAVTTMSQSLKSANNNEVVLETIRHDGREFSVMGYIRPQQPQPKP